MTYEDEDDLGYFKDEPRKRVTREQFYHCFGVHGVNIAWYIESAARAAHVGYEDVAERQRVRAGYGGLS
jgi:hypothetical protein